jgi:hypothetical protein
MNNQSTIETFAAWYQSKQAIIASKPVPTSIDYEGRECFLVMIPDMSLEERVKLAHFLLTDQAALLEQEFGEFPDHD